MTNQKNLLNSILIKAADFIEESKNSLERSERSLMTRVINNINLEIGQHLNDLVEEKEIKEIKKMSLVLKTMNRLLSDLNVDDHNRTSNKVAEVLKGGHVIIKDGGELYRELKEESLAKNIMRKRISSHHHDRKDSKKNHDIGIDTNTFGELLVGVTKNGDTYLQLEGAPVKDLWSFLKHMLDYIKYKITGKNVGRFGMSDHTEHSNPIILKKNEEFSFDPQIIPSSIKLDSEEKQQSIIR